MWMKATVVIGVASAIAGKVYQPEIERFLMRFFRDLSRTKAYNRRHGTDRGLVAMMTDTDPMEGILDAEQENESNMQTYTLEELMEFGDGQEDRPLLISIIGRVYDVTSGRKFYGPDGKYPVYGGREITYALATGCTTLECATTQYDFPSFTPEQQLEAKRWLSFFHLHDKYNWVGSIAHSPIEDIFASEFDHVNHDEKDEVMRELAAISGCTNPNFAGGGDDDDEEDDDDDAPPEKPTILQENETTGGSVPMAESDAAPMTEES